MCLSPIEHGARIQGDVGLEKLGHRALRQYANVSLKRLFSRGFLYRRAKMRAPVNSLKLLAIMSRVADPEVDLRGFT
jgi:hypothetical protein